MSPPTPSKDGLEHCAHSFFNKAVNSLHPRRNVQPLMLTPGSLIPTDMQVAKPKPATIPLVAVELSNYAPNISRHDIQTLFKGFMISLDFILPTAARFAYPLRTFIWLVGKAEAERAVNEVSGAFVGGRQLRVTLVDVDTYDQKEMVVAELADEMKIAIVNTAHVYNPRLGTKILEVREHIEGAAHFAFLQARDPVTVHSTPETHLKPNAVKWELVAGGQADARGARGQDRSVQLAALKSLQETVEKQGVAKRAWERWDGSRRLDLNI
ncbi:hypothetical protein CC86DRAFT_425574 [Ophiobolus disseminans]|uniref:RRM domain-containing protein n=1 Tax=Ophiobolus disseminans TaxID=1469910 RepID=A0A6A6ZML0_9PLEO|nr:hypothetical protein CC86DRAFT_425574 [Ophiobolus disseminans]